MQAKSGEKLRSVRDLIKKNKKIFISFCLAVSFILLFLSYNSNTIAYAGFPGQFDTINFGPEGSIFLIVQFKLSNPNSSIYDPNSNFYYPGAYRLQARLYAIMAQELQKSALSDFHLAHKIGFLESYAPAEISKKPPGYIAFIFGMKDNLEIGDVIIFKENGPRIVSDLEEQGFREFVYLNKTIQSTEVPLGFILNRPGSIPKIEHQLNVSLNNSILFLGYDISEEQISPGETFSITYYWKAISKVSKDYRILVHFIPVPNNMEVNETIRLTGHNILLNRSHEPLDGLYPTSKWVPGEVIVERYDYTMPKLPDGTYEIRLGMFDDKAGRLQIDQKNLGDIESRFIAGAIKVASLKALGNFSDSRIIGQYGISYPLADFFLYILFYFIRLMLVFLTAITIISLVYLIYREFGLCVSFVYFWMLCCSDWIIFYARSYFWMIFLYILPFVLSFWLYPRLGKTHKWIFFATIFLAVLARSLLDFEYITNLILMALVPIIYFDVLNKESFMKVAQNCLLAFSSGMAGFFAGLSITIFSLHNDYPGSFSDAINIILAKIADRTGLDNPYASIYINHYTNIGIFNKLHPYNNDFVSQILYVIDSRISYEQVNVVTGPIFHLSAPLYVIELIILLICYREIKKYLKGTGNRKIFSLSIATIASFVASNSWAILTANGHMKYHIHMNPIIFYFPFLLTAFILLSVKLCEVLNALFKLATTSSIMNWTTNNGSESLEDSKKTR